MDITIEACEQTRFACEQTRFTMAVLLPEIEYNKRGCIAKGQLFYVIVYV